MYSVGPNYCDDLNCSKSVSPYSYGNLFVYSMV